MAPLMRIKEKINNFKKHSNKLPNVLLLKNLCKFCQLLAGDHRGGFSILGSRYFPQALMETAEVKGLDSAS